jgi:hypothetical protein
MANVAGATKKSAMAVAIFIAYCVGNIVGPQLIRSQTKARHYPELGRINYLVGAAILPARLALLLLHHDHAN